MMYNNKYMDQESREKFDKLTLDEKIEKHKHLEQVRMQACMYIGATNMLEKIDEATNYLENQIRKELKQ